MNDFPEIHTERLTLRKIGIDDIPALVKYANNKKISDYVLNIPYPYNEPDAVFRIGYVVQVYQKKLRYVFSLVLKETSELIGEIGLHLVQNDGTAQLGYWVGEPYWNKGLVTEAIETVIHFGFDKLNLNTIYATCHNTNGASGKVLLKNGFVEETNNGSISLFEITKHRHLDLTKRVMPKP